MSMHTIKSIHIETSGDSSVGIWPARFEITGGDLITASDDVAEIEALREAINQLFENHITGEPCGVFLEGYDKPRDTIAAEPTK